MQLLRFPPKKGLVLSDLISFQLISEKSSNFLRLEFPSSKILVFASANFPKNRNPIRIYPFRPQLYYKKTNIKKEEIMVWKFYEEKEGEKNMQNFVNSKI